MTNEFAHTFKTSFHGLPSEATLIAAPQVSGKIRVSINVLGVSFVVPVGLQDARLIHAVLTRAISAAERQGPPQG